VQIVELTAAEWTVNCPTVDCVYLDWRWLNAIEAVYPRLRIVRLACVDAGVVLWLLPMVAVRPIFRRAPMWISVAFGNYGGFIRCADMVEKSWDESLRALDRYFQASNASALEIRGEKTLPSFSSSSYFKRFSLALPERETTLWERSLSSNARNMIRKVTKGGVSIEIDPQTGLGVFQRMYELQAKEHGTPIHAQNWFPELHRKFEGRCYTVVARQGSVPVGAAFMLDGAQTSFLHAVAWSRDVQGLPVADLLYWASICEAIKRGRSQIDFGRTRPIEGQLFFKRKWGAAESDLSYSYLLKAGEGVPLVVPESGKYRWATRLWSAMPIELQRLLGPRLRTHIPA
jgi:hypothetical protein